MCQGMALAASAVTHCRATSRSTHAGRFLPSSTLHHQRPIPGCRKCRRTRGCCSLPHRGLPLSGSSSVSPAEDRAVPFGRFRCASCSSLPLWKVPADPFRRLARLGTGRRCMMEISVCCPGRKKRGHEKGLRRRTTEARAKQSCAVVYSAALRATGFTTLPERRQRVHTMMVRTSLLGNW